MFKEMKLVDSTLNHLTKITDFDQDLTNEFLYFSVVTNKNQRRGKITKKQTSVIVYSA